MSESSPSYEEYKALVDQSCHNYPTLSRLAHTFDHQEKNGIAELGRAVVIEIGTDTINYNSFQDFSKFQKYVRRVISTPDDIKRLCILEDIVYHFVGTIGQALSINPEFFATHLHLVNASGHYRGAVQTGPVLPSTLNHNKSFSIAYYELFNAIPPVKDDGSECSNVLLNYHSRRKALWLPIAYNFATRSSIVGRRLSWWSSSQSNVIGNFLGVILVDPPLSRYGEMIILKDRGMKWVCKEEPTKYMGGYIQFSPWAAEKRSLARSSINRTSTLEDICDRLTSQDVVDQYKANNLDLELMCTTTVKNIAAANWMLVLELAKMSFRNLDWRIAGRSPLSKDVSELEAEHHDLLFLSNQSKTMELFRRYWGENREQVFVNMVQLGLSTATTIDAVGDGSSHDVSDQALQQRNWSYILSSLEFYISQANQVSSTIAARVANIEGGTSNRLTNETQSLAFDAHKIATLGFIFLPLSFLAGLFSMGDDFLPGKSKFWVFFAVAIPLSLLSLLWLRLDVLKHNLNRIWHTEPAMPDAIQMAIDLESSRRQTPFRHDSTQAPL